MSKKVEALKNMVFLSEQKPELLAGIIAPLITDTASSILMEGADSIKIPSGESVTETYSGKVLSQFGDTMTGTVTLSIDGDAPTGVSISDGVLTVASTTSAGSVVLKATSGTLTASKTVSLVASE